MTRPNTVPSTVSSELLTPKSFVVNFETQVTTIRSLQPHSLARKKVGVLVATRVKKNTSGQISLITVALNRFSVHLPRNSGFAATMVA